MENILIESAFGEVRVALLSCGVLQDIFVERKTAKGLVGNIFLGRVVRVLLEKMLR